MADKGFFTKAGDATDALANKRHQYIEIYHVPTDQSIKFKAFLTEFNDGFNSNWEDEDVYGRNDPISAFKNTKRTLTLGFDVPAASEQEAIENQQKLSLFQEMLYPTYSDQNGGASTINANPIFKIKFQNLIQNANGKGNAKTGGLLGKISGFQHRPDIESGFFDILNTESGPALFPQQFNIEFEFTVLHQHRLGWTNGQPRSEEFRKFPYGVNEKDPVRKVRAPNGDDTLSDNVKNAQLRNILLKGGIV